VIIGTSNALSVNELGICSDGREGGEWGERAFALQRVVRH
jgi:hypothetical protein